MPRRSVFYAIALLATAAAGWQAFALRWTCDDAYISFRYAQHFIEGHGLLFNLDAAEAPVEGYTNFVWTMWLAVGMALGCTGDAIEAWSYVSGALCHAGTVLLLAAIAWRASGGRAAIPIAACGYAGLHHAASLAPAGLETALFTLLVTALLRGVLVLRCWRDAWLLGFVGVLLAMTRPDGALFVGVAFLFVLHDAVQRRAHRLLVGYCLPFLAVFVPYLLWRRAYYGSWVPNTFYAKSAGDPYPGQGLRYVWEFAKCYWVLLPVLLVPCWWALRKPDLLAAVSPFLGRRPWLAVLGFFAPYLGFVIWVGGDFMFARFLVPILPVLLLSLDFACLRWRPRFLPPLLAALLGVGLALRSEPAWLADYMNPHGFSDNRAITVAPIWPGADLSRAEAARHCGHYLRELCRGLDVRLAIGGSHANLGHRANVPVVVECAAGLTDAYIARLPLARRGQPGHERGAALFPAYLERRGVHFNLELSYGAADPWRAIEFPSQPVPLPARLVTWDRDLMRELRAREPRLAVLDFEQVLDGYLADLPHKQRAQVRSDFAVFRAFYFDHNDDAARLRLFEEFLR